MSPDIHGLYDHWDEMDRIREEKFWQREQERMLAKLAEADMADDPLFRPARDQTPARKPQPPLSESKRRMGLFRRRENQDRGNER